MDTCDATTLPVPSCYLDSLEHQITELAAHIHAANYRLLCLIAEFDRREGWFQWGILSCAHWLNWKCGISMGPPVTKCGSPAACSPCPKSARPSARAR